MNESTKRKPIPTTRWLLFIPLAIVLMSLIASSWLLANGCRVSEIINLAIPALSGLGFTIVGTLITYYRPENRIGWLCLLIGAFFMVFLLFTSFYTECGLSGIELPALSTMAWLSSVFSPWGVALLFIFLPLWFPTGWFFSPRWRLVGLIILAFLITFTFLVALMPGQILYNFTGIIYPLDNPFGLAFIPNSLGPLLQIFGFLTLTIGTLLAILSLILRWQRSSGDTRQQLKWFAYFLATAVAVQILFFELFGAIFYPAIFETIYYEAIVLFVFLGFPTVIGISVLKYRLYDIDILIRRTLVYGVLTVLIVLIYFGTVIMLQSLFTAVSGQQSPVAIVLSTLVIAALFNPLRNRIQSLIDRRFFRQKYDADQMLADFAAKARDEVNLADLNLALIQVVKESLQPESISLWMRPMNIDENAKEQK